ncbi:F-box protein CPR1-like [Silene latifolia]|uniref:F-box protein CPR1-like n=1 Tax=Silene latifolia TaxID=37657 RepID=UPI003D76A8B4
MKIIRSPIPNDETPSLVMALLPVDIVHYNILIKLPAKSLLRFKSVCKDWYNLINSSKFISIHQKHTLESHDSCDLLLFFDSEITWTWTWTLFYTYLDATNYTSRIRTKMETFEDSFDIVGSFNGLICLKFSGSGFLLCNPVTREYSRLINCPNLFDPVHLRDVYYGSGYDVVSHDYKIVDIESRATEFGQDWIAYVYSTNSNSWKKDQKNHDPIRRWRYPDKSVVVNNKSHWITSNYTPLCSESILTFNLHAEELGEITYPTSLQTDRKLELMVSRGRLCTFATHPIFSNVSMWVMKEYGVVESWTLLYEIVGAQISTEHFRIVTHLSMRDHEEC